MHLMGYKESFKIYGLIFFFFCLTETREAVIEVGHCQKWCQAGPASDAQGQSPVTAAAH